jgi:hypothetical protein
MELVEAGEFLRWAAEGGIVPDPDGPDGQAPLTFGSASLHVRTWIAPEAPFNLPGFASCLLGAAAQQSSVYLFINGGAPWFTGSDPATGPVWEHLRDRIVGTLPILRDFRGALKMAFPESDDVVLMMVTFLVYAWCVADDLQVLPERRDVIMQTCHHGLVFVCASDPRRLEAFVTSMVEGGFPPEQEENA